MIPSHETQRREEYLLRVATRSDDLEIVNAAYALIDSLYLDGCEWAYHLYFPEGHYDERDENPHVP